MKLVGLTGGIATGKSTVAEMFVDLGARLIDADLLARDVVQPGKPAWHEIVQSFGPQVLNRDQTINREALAEIVFNEPPARQKLNSITHPRIGKELMERVSRYRKEGAEIVIFDAALLLETPAVNWIKPVVVVTADEETRIKRLKQRNGLTREQALSRIRAQWPDEKRAALADYVIDNSGTRDELRGKVEDTWHKLQKDC